MLEEVLDLLRPAPGMVVLDLTLGGGGYSAAFLESGARVIGLDLDEEAIAGASRRLSSHGDRFEARQTPFSGFPAVLDELGLRQVDGICMDLGLSSDQLADPRRGFSFQSEGAFDLRFDANHGRPAHAWLEGAGMKEIQGWLQEWGEVRAAGRIARVLHEAAQRNEVHSAAQVREAVISVLPRGAKPEPELARVFQAFRILVNDEMGHLDRALEAIPDALATGGRFVAVSYHSLEDRRVKSMLRRESGAGGGGSRHLPALEPRPVRMRVLHPRPLRPKDSELRDNPRARSARLRAGERLA
jgi:16S rRNA (cytosine1402-N4)-methyltransferase